METEIKEYIDNRMQPIEQTLIDINQEAKQISKTINNIQVNGRQGLQESLQDIYLKIGELYSVTEGERANKNLKTAIQEWMNQSHIVALVKTKPGKLISFAIVLALTNTVVKALGLELDVQSIWKWFTATLGIV